MDDETKELVRLLGKTTEDAGRYLQKKRELTLEELTGLQSVFRGAAESLEDIKDIAVLQHS